MTIEQLLTKETTEGMCFLQKHPEKMQLFFDIYYLFQEYYQNKKYDEELKKYLAITDTNHYFNIKNEIIEKPKSRE